MLDTRVTSLQQQQQASAARDAVTATETAAPLAAKQDAAWLTNSSNKVQTLLALVLPRLLTHAQPAVRQALAEVTSELLQGCSRALSNSRVALTEILLTLANDDYAEVAKPAVRWFRAASAPGSAAGSDAALGVVLPAVAGEMAAAAAPAVPQPMQLRDVAARLRKAAAGGTATSLAADAAATAVIPAAGALPLPPASTVVRPPNPPAPVLSDLLVDLCLQLPNSVRQSDASGTAAAKRTAAALLCAGPTLVASTILSKAPVLQQVCSALVATFSMDPTGAALLLRADAAVLGDLPAATAAGQGKDGTAAAAAAAGAAAPGPSTSPSTAGAAAVGSGLSSGTGVTDATARSAGSYPLLPRMPLSLQYLASAESYKAAAGVARALGRAARLADMQDMRQGEWGACRGAAVLCGAALNGCALPGVCNPAAGNVVWVCLGVCDI